jgi:hypothetical protein
MPLPRLSVSALPEHGSTSSALWSLSGFLRPGAPRLTIAPQ